MKMEAQSASMFTKVNLREGDGGEKGGVTKEARVERRKREKGERS